MDKQTLILTSEEASKLLSYILITTQYRQKEAAAWDSLSDEKNEDGTTKFPNAKSNADWWREMDAALDGIYKKL